MAAGGISTANGSLILNLRVLFWHMHIDFFEMMQAGKPKEKKQEAKSKKRGTMPLGMIVAMMRSFRVRKCFMAVDTGNYALNGMLYPFCTTRYTHINFTGRNELVLVITNNAARVLWAVIKNRIR